MKSAYINNYRFHAWQSSMLFSAIFVSLFDSVPFRGLCLTYRQVIHLIFAWSSFLSWTLFIIDILLIGFLSMRAYRDGNSVPRTHLQYNLY